MSVEPSLRDVPLFIRNRFKETLLKKSFPKSHQSLINKVKKRFQFLAHELQSLPNDAKGDIVADKLELQDIFERSKNHTKPKSQAGNKGK